MCVYIYINKISVSQVYLTTTPSPAHLSPWFADRWHVHEADRGRSIVTLAVCPSVSGLHFQSLCVLTYTQGLWAGLKQ